MTLNETLKQLKARGNEKTRAHNTKNGAGDNQFGVSLGDIRRVQKGSTSRRCWIASSRKWPAPIPKCSGR
jgi:hypothetical protein